MKARKIRAQGDGSVHTVKMVMSSRCGKNGYSSRKLALHAAAMARKIAGENVHVYKCGPCHCWHIGHPPGLPRTLAN